MREEPLSRAVRLSTPQRPWPAQYRSDISHGLAAGGLVVEGNGVAEVPGVLDVDGCAEGELVGVPVGSEVVVPDGVSWGEAEVVAV